MKPETITRTEVEAVEKEYVLCPLCEMDHDPDDMISVRANPRVRLRRVSELCWLNKEDGREQIFDNLSVTSEAETVLCPSCAENIGLKGATAKGRDFDEIDSSPTLPDMEDLGFLLFTVLWMSVVMIVMMP